jgi:hypothetical protein
MAQNLCGGGRGSVGEPAFTFVLVFIVLFLSSQFVFGFFYSPGYHGVGNGSIAAFKWVLVFIALFLSDLF